MKEINRYQIYISLGFLTNVNWEEIKSAETNSSDANVQEQLRGTEDHTPKHLSDIGSERRRRYQRSRAVQGKKPDLNESTVDVIDVFHNNKKEQITVVVNLLSDEMLENEALCKDQIPTDIDTKADRPGKNNENISVIGELLAEASQNILENDIAEKEADQTQIFERQYPKNAENDNDEGYINIYSVISSL